MPQFRSMTAIEAFQLRDPDEPGHVDAFHAWADRVELRWESDRNGAIVVHTSDAEDVLGAEEGDWIVAKGGETFAVFGKDDFDAQYEPEDAVTDRAELRKALAEARSRAMYGCRQCWDVTMIVDMALKGGADV